MERLQCKYGEQRGKRESYQLYVIYDCPLSELQDYLKHQRDLFDKISDSFRRRLMLGRNHLFHQYLLENKVEGVINGLFFVADTLDREPLSPEWLQTLREYTCPHIQIQTDDHYDFKWLTDLCTNREPEAIVHVDDKTATAQETTATRSKLLKTSSLSNTESLVTFLDSLPASTKSILLYGPGRFLKGFSHPKVWKIVNGHLSRIQIWETVQERLRIQVEEELKQDLRYLDLPNQGHRLKFKKEIPNAIMNGNLAKLYLRPDMVTNFQEKCQANGLEMTFKIIPIDSSLLDQYNGVVGVTYY